MLGFAATSALLAKYSFTSKAQTSFRHVPVRRARNVSNRSNIVMTNMPLNPIDTATLDEELTLETHDGIQIGAFLTMPSHSCTQRAVILMTDIFGYKDEETRGVARRLARSGLTTSRCCFL